MSIDNEYGLPEEYLRKTNRSESDDAGCEVLHSHSADSGGDTDVDSDDEDDTFDLFDASFFGLDNTPMGVVLGGDEADIQSSPDVSTKLAESAHQNLSVSRRRDKQEKAHQRVTAEDFEPGPERNAYIIVETHKNGLFGHKASFESRKAAINFFFTANDDGGATFKICAQALNARIDVVRLRIHYEFWLRWAIASEEFPFFTVPLPKIVEGEILYHCGMEGMELAAEAWIRPGITQAEMLINASGVNTLQEVPAKYIHALKSLEERFILSPQADNWFITGRNPLLQRFKLEQENGRVGASSTVSWSKLWGLSTII